MGKKLTSSSFSIVVSDRFFSTVLAKKQKKKLSRARVSHLQPSSVETPPKSWWLKKVGQARNKFWDFLLPGE